VNARCRVTLLGTAAIALSAVCGCHRFVTSPHVHYVVPIGFRGAIVVYTNDAAGTSLPSQKNSYTCIVPETGILRLREKGPFYSWHTTSASFADGTSIPVAQPDASIEDETILFWSGGARPDGMIYDFVGTKAEKKLFDKETAAGDIVPGRVR
jgi:hypothetical protein